MFDALLVHISTSYIHQYVRSAEPQLGQFYIAEYAATENYDVKVKKYSSHEPILNSLIYSVVQKKFYRLEEKED